jgi:hypothetical protein
VLPPKEPSCEKKKPLAARVDEETVTGYVMLTKEKLKEEDQGIKIIVNGRKITKDFFGAYGDKSDRITGYLQADVLVEDLGGDKTSVRRSSSHWRQLYEKIASQLMEFNKEIKAIKEDKLPEKMMCEIQQEINDILKNFPELQDMAKKAGISLYGGVLVASPKGQTTAQSTEGTQQTEAAGEEGSGSGGGGEGTPAPGGENPQKAPIETGGNEHAAKVKKRKRGINILLRPDQRFKSEAWFSPGDGNVYVNSAFPTFKLAEKMYSKHYHVMRSSIDALLEYAADNGYITGKDIKAYRLDVYSKWGEH